MSNISKIPSQANLKLNTKLPVRIRIRRAQPSQNVSVQLPSSNLALSRFAPVVSPPDIPSGDIRLSSSAPTIAQTFLQLVTIPSSNLSFTTTAMIVWPPEVPPADLALQTFAPVIARSVNYLFEIEPADALIMFTAPPDLEISDNRLFSVLAASLRLTTDAVSKWPPEVPSAELVVLGFPPDIIFTDHRSIEVPNTDVSLSTFEAEVSYGSALPHTVEIAAASLHLSTFTTRSNIVRKLPLNLDGVPSVAKGDIVLVLEE